MIVSLGSFLESEILKAPHQERSGMHWTDSGWSRPSAGWLRRG